MKKLADILHKTAVTGLMGLTVVAAGTFSYQVYQFLSMTEERKAAARKKAETKEYFKIMALINKLGQKFQALFRMAKCYATPSLSYASQPKTWKVLRANHVAVATGNLDKSVDFYRNVLGIKASEGVPLPEHGVTTVFVELPNLKLELLLPLGEKSPIENFLQKNTSGGMHHICLEVDNIQNAVKDLKEKNIRMLNDEPKIGAHGKPVVFLHPKDCGGILIELEEV